MPFSIGQRLKEAREYRLLTLEKASEATHIRINYLRALETDDYSIMPSAAQGRGFLRNYAEYLDLDLDKLIEELQKQAPQETEISGPLPMVELITEPPPPVEEMPSPPVRTRPLPRSPKTASASENGSSEPAPVEETTSSAIQADEEKTVKSRGRKKKMVESSEALLAEEQVVKPRGRRKKIVEVQEPPPTAEVAEPKLEVETLPVEAEQPPAASEAQTEAPKPSLFARAVSFLRGGVKRPRPQVQVEEPKSSEPEPTKVETPVPEPSGETAEEIFLAIGAELRQRRELISLTFNEVERLTKVRAQFLKEMEAGAFDKLPSPVQTRGMLTNYASFLDLDPDMILLRFADALQARHRMKYPRKSRPKNLLDVAPRVPPLRTFIAGDLIFGVVMVVMLAVLAIWGVGRVMNSQQEAQSPLPTAPSISDVLAGTPQPTVAQEVTFIPVAGTQFASITQEPTEEVVEVPIDVNIQVIVNVVERAFVRVSVDGEVAFDGRVMPGETLTYNAEEQVSILTGNGAALLIKYNGRDLGLMGDFGQVVSQIYLASGLATPTATLEPTATVTPLVSPTPTATETPTPTVASTATP